jgi:hypothetical protein
MDDYAPGRRTGFAPALIPGANADFTVAPAG